MRSETFHEAVLLYRLCKEFGWTPQTINRQSALDIEYLVTVLNELDLLENIVAGQDPDSTTILIE